MSAWTDICGVSDLVSDSGICALYKGEQVAIFKFETERRVFAVSNFDPIGEANVMSRGILGTLGTDTVVASPLYKQHFCLETGRCLEDESQWLKTYPVRVHKGQIQLRDDLPVEEETT